MSILVICEECQARFNAKSEWAGKKAKCPKCGKLLTIGQSSSTAAVNPSSAANAAAATPSANSAQPGSPWSNSPAAVPQTATGFAPQHYANGNPIAYPATPVYSGNASGYPQPHGAAPSAFPYSQSVAAMAIPTSPSPAVASSAVQAAQAAALRRMQSRMGWLVVGFVGLATVLIGFGVWHLRSLIDRPSNPPAAVSPWPNSPPSSAPAAAAPMIPRLDQHFVQNPPPPEVKGDWYRFPSFGLTLQKPKGFELSDNAIFPGFNKPTAGVKSTVSRASDDAAVAGRNILMFMAQGNRGKIVSQENVMIETRRGVLLKFDYDGDDGVKMSSWNLSVEANQMAARINSLVIQATFPVSREAEVSQLLKDMLLTAKIDP